MLHVIFYEPYHVIRKEKIYYKNIDLYLAKIKK